MPVFYDTHAHLDYPELAADLPQIIERAQAAGITRIITIGTDLDSSRRAMEIAEQFPDVFAAVGWHPSDVLKSAADVRPELRELAGTRRSWRWAKPGWTITACRARARVDRSR